MRLGGKSGEMLIDIMGFQTIIFYSSRSSVNPAYGDSLY